MSFVSIAVSLIISLILIAVAVLLLTQYRSDRRAEPKGAVERARGVECLARMRRFQTAVEMFYADSGCYPQRLDDIPELQNEDFSCPVEHGPYRYNRGTGKVSCPFHHSGL